MSFLKWWYPKSILLRLASNKLHLSIEQPHLPPIQGFPAAACSSVRCAPPPRHRYHRTAPSAAPPAAQPWMDSGGWQLAWGFQQPHSYRQPSWLEGLKITQIHSNRGFQSLVDVRAAACPILICTVPSVHWDTRSGLSPTEKKEKNYENHEFLSDCGLCNFTKETVDRR